MLSAPSPVPAPATTWIEGPADGETLVFVQGWPDDRSLWDAAVARLSQRYRCVRLEIPNFAGDVRRWGYDHDQMVEWLANAVRQVSSGPVVLVTHDWGAYWGWLLQHRHPQLVRAIVGLDIAPEMKPNLREVAILLGYQWWLVAAFLLGGRCGNAMTRGMARLLGAPRPDQAHAAMNYPYWHAWRDIFSGRAARLFRGYAPTLPILFIYGENKPGRFHTERWLEHVRSLPGGAVLALPTGHWVTTSPAFLDSAEAWLGGGRP